MPGIRPDGSAWKGRKEVLLFREKEAKSFYLRCRGALRRALQRHAPDVPGCLMWVGLSGAGVFCGQTLKPYRRVKRSFFVRFERRFFVPACNSPWRRQLFQSSLAEGHRPCGAKRALRKKLPAPSSSRSGGQKPPSQTASFSFSFQTNCLLSSCKYRNPSGGTGKFREASTRPVALPRLVHALLLAGVSFRHDSVLGEAGWCPAPANDHGVDRCCCTRCRPNRPP